MRRSYYSMMIVLAGLFVTSCSSKYNDTISNYIQTVDGQTEKLDIKIKEVKELKKVTVGDSITYINLQAEQILKKQAEEVEKQLATYQEDLVKANSGAGAKIIVEAYTNQIAKTKSMIDSLKAIKPESTKLYDGKKTDEILAVVVECKYTKVDSSSREKSDITKNFVLSSDGKVCYGTTDDPTMSMGK